jgi:hypothetical protein
LILEILAYGRKVTKIPALIKFVAALSFLAHGSYQKLVGSKKQFAMSYVSVHSQCLYEIVQIIFDLFLLLFTFIITLEPAKLHSG